MCALKKVVEIRKQLGKITSDNSSGQELNLLKELQTLKINLDILTKTSIGKTVNALRKASKEKAVIVLCKKLLKDWRKLLDQANLQDLPGTSNPQVNSPKTKNEDTAKESKKNEKISAALSSAASDLTKFSAVPPTTTDSIRLKCREMLAKALLPDSEEDCCMSVNDLEEAIFKEFKGTDTKYKNRVRSIISNLTDPKNALRTKCRIGALTAQKLAKMTSADMANDEVRQLKEKYNQEAINRAQLATRGQGTKTDMFKCDKCQKRNTTYMQLQTLSSDEPMTTFVSCNECGNRWMFC